MMIRYLSKLIVYIIAIQIIFLTLSCFAHECINPINYGANNDGTNADLTTSAFKTAIQASANTAGGIRPPIYVSPGIYRLNEPLIFPNGVGLIGEGQAIGDGAIQSRLLFDGLGNVDAMQFSGAAIRIENIGVTFTATNCNGLSISNATSGHIQNIRLENCNGYGLKIIDSWGIRFTGNNFFTGGAYLYNAWYIKCFGTILTSNNKVTVDLAGTTNQTSLIGCHIEGSNLSGVNYLIYDHSSGANQYIGSILSAHTGQEYLQSVMYFAEGGARSKIHNCSINYDGPGGALAAIKINHSAYWGWHKIIGNSIQGTIIETGNTNRNVIMGNDIIDSTGVYIIKIGNKTQIIGNTGQLSNSDPNTVILY